MENRNSPIEETYAPSKASLDLAKGIYLAVENQVTEDTQVSQGEVIMAIAQVIQEVRDRNRKQVVAAIFANMN